MKIKAVEDFKAHLQFLEDSIRHYHEDKPEYFLMIDLHLWFLLCDAKKAKPLIERIYPQFGLHPIKGLTVNGEEEPPLLKMHRILGPDHILLPGSIHGNGTGKFIVDIWFDENAKRIKLSRWLRQPYLSEKFTIQRFLDSVRNKMGAHPDPDYDDLLMWAKSFRISGEPSLELASVGLGEYVLRQIQAYAMKESP